MSHKSLQWRSTDLFFTRAAPAEPRFSCSILLNSLASAQMFCTIYGRLYFADNACACIYRPNAKLRARICFCVYTAAKYIYNLGSSARGYGGFVTKNGRKLLILQCLTLHLPHPRNGCFCVILLHRPACWVGKVSSVTLSMVSDGSWRAVPNAKL